MNNRRINAAGLALVKQWEGLKTKAYRDVGGIWTIGYGHTSAAGAPTVTPTMMITEAKAEEILRADLAIFEDRVSRLAKVPLTENQFAVLVSFDFNTGKLGKSTLLKKLNAGDYDAVPLELMKWVNAGGKRVKGLVNRRAAEAGLWAKGEFVSSNTTPAVPKAPDVVTKENVSWAAGILSTIAFAFTGNGPLQWALAGILVVAFAIGAFFFLRNRLDPA
ncbi:MULTISPECIES: glycoside hydrolase family protein [unclassified Ensifer]|uniref:lysozyme n=1 Tax=unclassified Ensifer TaxID=2633371 RepID=UPI00070AF4F5|nr:MULTISPECIES: glycoside hydrolase family protein [unclassified Ensifer]KQW62849.1 lysozyme [Ensifer sp. Root1252]KRC83670.1 lysozyme [Ensifer sp. Root231]KRD04023.1 lysozyme [Ensifer sp. Root258]